MPPLKIDEYRVVSYYYAPNKLVDEVNEAIKEGWTPHGELQVTLTTIPNPDDKDKFDSLLVYTQVLVKYGR